jgi:transcriptional regulator with XRE-family HTH domain
MKDTVHLGENIRRILDLKGIKQEVFAEKMGVSQTAISKLLSTPKIDDERLKEVADKLGVSVEAIKRFDADAVMLFIENINSYDHSTGSIARIDIYNIHPIEEVTKLYERMLKEKNDEIEKLRQELGKK